VGIDDTPDYDTPDYGATGVLARRAKQHPSPIAALLAECVFAED
jgi:hypothetical protein